MRAPFQTRFGAIFWNEVLLNSKRVATYVVAMLCAGNALLWWAKGPAAGQGWATNADFFIAGVLPPYSFLFLPLYTALMMADPAIRDFRAGIDPLIFSKPVTRAEYLLGKFFGNFFVLTCCQSAFSIMFFALQWIPKQGMVVQEKKFFLYPKHFFVFVVISHLVLAAIYFTVGTLTRNAKIVYGLGVAFYPLYITYQTVLLKSLPVRWRVVLDPLLMNWGNPWGYKRSAEVLNRLVIVYDSNLIINRAGMILLAAMCLTILYARFARTERSGTQEKFSLLNLSTAAEGVYYPESLPARRLDQFEKPDHSERAFFPRIALPEVARVNEGIRANVNKLIAALGVEFRLLRAERSLVVTLPLATFLSLLEVAFYNIPADVSYSAAYATNTAKLLLLFLLGMTVFYTGEAMHRDREVRIESVVWTAPAPNYVLLLSKFLTTFLLTLSLITLVGLAAGLIQLFRGHTPVEISAYLLTYSVVLLPTIFFTTAASIVLNVLLRDKYFAYAVSIATGGGLLYLYNLGYNHWLYNPALYQLWTYHDLVGAGSGQSRILTHRIYWLALSCLCLAIAHLGFRRKSTKGFRINGRFGSSGWALVVTIVSLAVAAVTGSMIK
jgi:ABC-type transport system involved in multi-copper enzyme maturation permease subunit